MEKPVSRFLRGPKVIANYLGVSRAVVIEAIHSGRLPGRQIGTDARSFIVTAAALKRHFEEKVET
jgi:excisionase family DNA binding protein